MDDNFTKIMSSLDLDYSKAILSTAHFAQQIQSLNKQLQGMKGIALQSAKDINTVFASQLGGRTGSKTIVDQYGNALKTVQTEAKKANTSISNISKSSKNLASSHVSIANAAKQHSKSVKDVKNQYDMLGNEFQRRASWFITGGLFYGSISAAKETVSSIKEVEIGMVEIARVMEDSTFRFNDYRDQLLQLGVDYGQSFENVQDIALRWAQAGYNVKDSLDLTKTALLALNTAELDATNATESMIGIMSQWKMTASDLPLLMDKINKTADDFTVTSQDLVDGLLRSSSAARIMNLDIDETISLLTIMREASGRTGREVGNALNSILSYIQRPSSIKALESLGINMFADEAKTQFRSVMEIFQDVSSKWNTASNQIKDSFIQSADDAGLFSEELATALGLQEEWNDLQQRDIAQASAGVYRRNYYIGMIERLSNAQDVLNNITDAAGYSQSENARTMDTLEKKYESLKTSVTQLAVALGDAGLLDALKGITDVATEATQWIATMDDEGRALLLTVLEITAAVTALKGISGLFTTKNILLGATTLLPGWTKLLAIIPGVISAIALYKHNLDSSAQTIDSFSKRQEKIIKNFEAQTQAWIESRDNMLSEAKAAETLADRLEALNQKENLNISEKSQMKAIVEQLNTVIPNLSLSIDEQTGKVIDNTSAIYDNINALKDQALQQARTAEMQASAKKYVEQELIVGDISTTLQKTRSEYNDLLKRRIKVAEEIKQAIESNTYVTDSDSASRQQAIMQAMSDAELYGWNTSQLNTAIIGIDNKFSTPGLKQQIVDSQKFVGNLEKQFDEANSLLLDYDKELQRFADEITKNSENQSERTPYVPSTNPATSSSSSKSDTYKNSALEEALKVLDYRKYINDITVEDEIATLNEIKAKHVNTADELMDINKRIYSAEKTLQADKEKLIKESQQQEISNLKHLVDLGVYSVEQQIEAYKELYSVKAESIDEEQERIKNLFNLYQKLLDEQQSKIKDAYDERIQMIEDEADAEKAKKEARIADLQEELDLLDKQDSQRSYEQNVSDIRKQIEYWQVRTSEEARKKVIELEQQLDEEKYKHELEQQKESINDKIDELEDEVDEIDRLADEEKKKWEKSYKLTEKAFDEHSSNIVALAGAMSKEAYEQWEQNYLTPLQEALSSGNFSEFDDISSNLDGSISDLKNSSNAQIYNVAKSILSLKKQWTDGDLTAAGKATQYYNQLYSLGATGKSVADQLTLADYSTAKDIVANLPRYHTGRLNGMEGLAVLRKDEIVFPPELSRGLRALFPIIANLGTRGDSYDNRKEIKINNLVNIENNRMEDDVDESSFAREINRALNSVL